MSAKPVQYGTKDQPFDHCNTERVRYDTDSSNREDSLLYQVGQVEARQQRYYRAAAAVKGCAKIDLLTAMARHVCMMVQAVISALTTSWYIVYGI